MILPKDKYISTVKRPYPPLWSSLIVAAQSDEAVYTPFFSKPYARRNILLLNTVWYYEIETEELGKKLISLEWKNEEIIQKVILELRKRENYLLKAVNEPFEIFVKIYKEFQASMAIVYLAENPFFDKLKSILLEKITEIETNELLDLLNIPLEDNYYKKEELDLVENTDLAVHVRKYEWLISRYGSNTPYTLENAKQKLAEIDKEKYLHEYNETKENVKKAIIRAKEIVGQELSYLVNGMQFIVFYRTHRTDVINRVKYEYIPILSKMAENFGITYDDILFCMEEEILNKNIPSKTIFEERKKGHAVAILGDRIVCLIGKEYEKIKKDFEDNLGEQTEVNGTIACKGFVTGKVIIIDDKRDFDKVKEGDVLVASMTTPEMVPIMKLASAFVTDEGGITCHAAIVSREMKKPCIIGTKIATKVLKDGDMVEVDAEKGIVRILK